jgi:hypothetical protein
VIPEHHQESLHLSKADEGIIPRAIKGLFQRVQQIRDQHRARKVSISCSYIQLYNEKIFDLLNTDAYKRKTSTKLQPGLKLKWTPNDDAVIENLYCFECQNVEECMKQFWKGLKNKMMAAHRINNASSRSHCVLTL